MRCGRKSEADSTAEGGSATGSNFIIGAYDNTGASLGNALSIARNGLAATFTGSVTTPTLIATTVETGSEVLTSTLTGTSAYFNGTVTASNISANTGYFTGTVTAANFSGNITGNISISDGSANGPGLYFTNETKTGLFRHGSGEFGFSVIGYEALELEGVTNAANYVTITPAVTGSAPIISVAGDVNAGLILSSAGSGNITLTPGSSGNTIISAGGLGVATGSLQSGYEETVNGGLYSMQSSTTAAGIYGTNDTTGGTSGHRPRCWRLWQRDW